MHKQCGRGHYLTSIAIAETDNSSRIPTFFISGGSHLKKMEAILKTSSHFEFRNVKFPSLTRKPLEKCNFTILCDGGKGNSAILHVRGQPFKKMAAILKNWQPFLIFKNVKFNILDQKNLEQCYYTNFWEKGKGNFSLLLVRGSHFENMTAILKNWQPF